MACATVFQGLEQLKKGHTEPRTVGQSEMRQFWELVMYRKSQTYNVSPGCASKDSIFFYLNMVCRSRPVIFAAILRLRFSPFRGSDEVYYLKILLLDYVHLEH